MKPNGCVVDGSLRNVHILVRLPEGTGTLGRPKRG